jgi:hypothetical protein
MPTAPETPRVALVMPHYGDVNLNAARGLLCDASDGRVKVHLVAPPRLLADSASSATPHTFNGLFALALDARDRGEITHFAMLHSDIAPERGWLDVLWQEMVAHSADLVSAVSPIKEPERVRTSTAIGQIGFPWAPLRYVAMADRAKLPPTFGPEHVCDDGEELLVNTGCFLADLRREYWDHPNPKPTGKRKPDDGEAFAFNFDCRITKRDDGTRVAQFDPEDWEMSRMLNRNGARYLATWRVALVHHGAAEWSTYP